MPLSFSEFNFWKNPTNCLSHYIFWIKKMWKWNAFCEFKLISFLSSHVCFTLIFLLKKCLEFIASKMTIYMALLTSRMVNQGCNIRNTLHPSSFISYFTLNFKHVEQTENAGNAVHYVLIWERKLVVKVKLRNSRTLKYHEQRWFHSYWLSNIFPTSV